MHEVAAAILPEARALILSGPSFAGDVLKGLPTAVTLAAPEPDAAAHWAKAFTLPSFRVYGSDDVPGVAIGGAMKNVLAIACGISDGRGLGDSARAALTTRGFAELTRFGKKLGARPETLTGLSGLGDLLLTCSSRQSRNYSFGLALGRRPDRRRGAGFGTGCGRRRLYRPQCGSCSPENMSVDMPIVAAVHAIIDEGANPDDEIARLLARPVRAEIRD